MKIGIAGPISLQQLAHRVEGGEKLPKGYQFAPMAVWVEGLLQRGHSVSVFTLDPDTEGSRSFYGDRLAIHIGNYRNRGRARDFFSAERKVLLEAMNQDPVDVMHAHWTYEFALAALASPWPTVVTAHDAPLHILRLYPEPYRAMRAVMALRVAHTAPVLTAVSPYVADHFRKVLGYSGAIRVIPNGLPEQLFELGEVKRSKSGLVFATVLVGWGGRKNGQVALQAFREVRKKIPDARLLMFGGGHGSAEEGAKWAKTRGLEEGVSFIGAVPYGQLLKTLSEEVDVFVHPALEEAHPMAVIEAMALGLPVIGGKRSGGVPFTLEEGNVGLLADVRSPYSLAAAMLKLAMDQDGRVDLGLAGRESARTRFSIDRMLSSYEEVYAAAIGNRKR